MGSKVITFKHKGDFKHTEKLFGHVTRRDWLKALRLYGEEGVRLLARSTPEDSGETAASWDYRIQQNDDGISILFINTNINKGVNIAIILQYGHGTGTGGYVKGRDYINPAIRPVFDAIAHEAWKEVIH